MEAVTARRLPNDPFDLVPNTTFAPAARRSVELWPATSGRSAAQVELWWLPSRQHRSGAPTVDRPAFTANPADRILAEETLWTDGDHALTPNRHPFDPRHLLLWSRTPRREPDAAMLATAFGLASGFDGAVLGNSMGAAASIARAHLHLIGSRQEFLSALPTESWQPAAASAEPALARVQIRRAVSPFPALLVAITGAVDDRAAMAAALIRDRTTPAYNLIDQDGTTWLFPRSAIETPAPHFPQALGSAELWGRWCHQDRVAFDGATAQKLLAALGLAGRPPL